jgi:pseudolysin
MDPHLSSGVFNKAFYLLAHQPDWSVAKAFTVMLEANQKYWLPSSTFESAACGVIQAAKDRQWNKQAVVDSFKEVGVTCPITSI